MWISLLIGFLFARLPGVDLEHLVVIYINIAIVSGLVALYYAEADAPPEVMTEAMVNLTARALCLTDVACQQVTVSLLAPLQWYMMFVANTIWTWPALPVHFAHAPNSSGAL
jgi:hypothetical protein